MLNAIELSLFDALKEPVTSEEVARKLSTHAGNTKFFLDGLVCCDLAEKKDGLYRNTPVAETFLTSDSPTYLGDFLTRTSKILLQLSGDMMPLIKNGPQKETREGYEGAQDVWSGLVSEMTRYALSGNAQKVTGIISQLPEFPTFSKMLDLGGCSGGYAMTFIAAHPDLRAVLFDQPAVIREAEPLIEEYGYTERIETMGGDFISDAIGEGYDFIWASATLNFCRDSLHVVLKKAYDALEPGGVFACMQEGLTNKGSQPQEIVLPLLPWVFAGEELLFFRQGQLAELLIATGFKSVRSQTITTTDGVMDIDIARK